MLAHLFTRSLHPAPLKLPHSTMSYVSTSAQHGPYTQPLLKVREHALMALSMQKFAGKQSTRNFSSGKMECQIRPLYKVC